MDFSLPPQGEEDPSTAAEGVPTAPGYFPPPDGPAPSAGPSSQLEDLFSRTSDEPHGSGYSLASPTSVVPPTPEWNLPASTQASVDRAMAGGYEVGTHAESPYAPPPAHFAPPPPPPPALYEQVQQDFPGSPVDPYKFSSQEQRQTWTVPSPGAPVAPQPAASSILEHRTQPLAGILDDLDFGEADDDDAVPGPEVHMAGDVPGASLMGSPLANAAAHLDAPERDTGPVTPPPPVVAARDTGPIPPLPSVAPERDTGPVTPPPPVVAARDTGPIPPLPSVAPERDTGPVTPPPPVVAARDTGPIPPLPSVAPERDTGPVTPLPEVTLETEQPPPVAIARTSVEQEVDQSAERVASPPAVPTPGQVSDRNELPPPRVGPPAFAAEPDVRHVVLGFRDGSAVFLEADHPLFGLFFQWSELVAGPSMPEKLYARPRRAPDMFVGRPSRGKVTRES